MGYFKIMTRACMPRHARTCLFLTLSLYMIMHVFNKLSFSLPSIHVHVCPFVCLCMNIHVSVCTCVCMYVCVCASVYARACVRMYWSLVRILYSGRRALTPSPDKNPVSCRNWVRLAVHPSIEHCKLIN